MSTVCDIELFSNSQAKGSKCYLLVFEDHLYSLSSVVIPH